MIAVKEQSFRERLGESIISVFPTVVVITLISPAQGALFAPLALQFVQSDPFILFLGS